MNSNELLSYEGICGIVLCLLIKSEAQSLVISISYSFLRSSKESHLILLTDLTGLYSLLE